MAMTLEEKRRKQQVYNRQYYLAHRERKLEQNARSANRWREKYPEKYRLSQERCRTHARLLKGLGPRRPKIRECVMCHQIKLHKAREMCVVCYGKWRWENHKNIRRTLEIATPFMGTAPMALTGQAQPERPALIQYRID